MSVAREKRLAVRLEVGQTTRPRAQPEKQFTGARHLLADGAGNVATLELEGHIRLQRCLRRGRVDRLCLLQQIAIGSCSILWR
jgi:hypothetical protein